ncbi:hypothetical protein M8J77_000714 [Diaphorina citri]|nr:hypothetical protein M8J77_000714 [Diaphorina citri]
MHYRAPSSGRRSLASEEEDEVVVLVSEDVDLLVILIGTRSPSNVYFLKPGRGKVVPVLYHPQTTIETSLAEHILFIHAISGCDSTSALFNQGKVKALRTVVKNPDLLPYIRRFLDPASTTREITEAGERFLIVLYGGNHETTSLNKLRYKSYVTSAFKVTSYIAALPPTESAASQQGSSSSVTAGVALLQFPSQLAQSFEQKRPTRRHPQFFEHPFLQEHATKDSRLSGAGLLRVVIGIKVLPTCFQPHSVGGTFFPSHC